MANEDSRPRYHGSVEDLVAAIKPFVTKLKWLQYGEDPKSKVMMPVIVAHTFFLKALYDLQENLAFLQSSTKATFLSIGRTMNDTWQLSDTDLDDWAETMAKRTRTMCRHLQTSMSRVPRPKWTTSLSWLPPPASEKKSADDVEQVAAPSAASSSSSGTKKVKVEAEVKAEPDDAEGYTVSYDDELGIAKRTKGKKGQPQTTADIYIPPGSQPEDPVVARWADGFEHRLRSSLRSSGNSWRMRKSRTAHGRKTSSIGRASRPRATPFASRGDQIAIA